MADWKDVMNARSEADRLQAKALQSTDGESMVAFAILTVAQEIRALAVSLDYNESQRSM